MKRWLALWLTIILGLAGMMPAAQGEESGTENALVVGTLTPMSGSFFTDMWGNNTSDMDVRAVLHGYATVAWIRDGDFVIDDTTVKQVKYADDRAGNRTYSFTLNDDLTYNDGTPVLARDYVFAVLLRSCPQVVEIGGMNQAFNHLMGYEAFQEGKAFTGVRLLGEREFSLTIKKESLPYFYEMQMVNVEPAPMDVIAPGFEIVDDGRGAMILAEDGEENEGLTAQLLQRTLLDPETGYVSHPMRTCGPYQMESIEPEKQEAVFTLNESYLGNYEGQKPEIEKVTFVALQPETMFDDLRSGRVDLINKVSDGEAISQGLLLRQENFSALNYPRAGLNMLAFACELGPTQSKYLRQAVAMCIDAQDLCDTFLQGYGTPVYGYYGLGQWMSQEWMKEEPDSLLELCVYSYDLGEATRMLEEDGWIYDENGDLYAQGELKGIRYRKDGEDMERLVLKVGFAEGNALVPYMQENLIETLKSLGIDVECDVVPFPELLKQYYRQTERKYNIMLLATNFQYVFDPYYTFNAEDAYQGVHNTTGIRDEKLMKLADDMRRAPPGDKAAYLDKWMEFQKHWIDDLPMAPLYSNVYFDFFRPDLQNYLISSSNTWAAAILYSYLGEPREVEEDPVGGVALEEEDGETVILE